MRRESEFRELEFRILKSPGDWVIVIKHYTSARRISFSWVTPMRFACEEVAILSCLFVSSSRIPWAIMSIYVIVFSQRQSGPVAFFFHNFFPRHPCLTPSGQPEVAALGRTWGLLKA